MSTHVAGDQNVWVIRIKLNLGLNSDDLCEEFPCHPTVICNINMGGSWDISHPRS